MIYRHRERNKSCRLWHKGISAKKAKQLVLLCGKVLCTLRKCHFTQQNKLFYCHTKVV